MSNTSNLYDEKFQVIAALFKYLVTSAVWNIREVAKIAKVLKSFEDLGRFKNLEVVIDLKGLPHFQRFRTFREPEELGERSRDNLEDPTKGNNCMLFADLQ